MINCSPTLTIFKSFITTNNKVKNYNAIMASVSGGSDSDIELDILHKVDTNKCCYYAKKIVARDYKQKHDIDLSITGIRKAEGGARASAYKNCFTSDVYGVDEYRPIFWFKKEDKESYCKIFNVTHSDCYTQYGLTRTGCAGCPYNTNFEKELEIIKEYEPMLYRCVNNIFSDSYAYTRSYRNFVETMKKRSK